MNNLVVLGSTGFIGQSLVSALKAVSDYKIITAGRSGCDLQVDLLTGNYEHLIEQVNPGDVVVFLAAIASPDACAKNEEEARQVNVNSTLDLIAKLTEKKIRTIFSSSDVVFGGRSGTSYDDSPTMPTSLYAEMKSQVESAVSGNDYVKIIRFSLVLGRGDTFTNMLSSEAKKESTVDIFSGFKRNAVSINDVLTGIINLALRWNEFPAQNYNFSGPDLLSREEITSKFTKVIPKLKFSLQDAPSGFWDNRDRVIETDCKNFTLLLGRSPKNLDQIISEWD